MDCIDLWTPRNQMIAKTRAAIAGENPISAPTSMQFKVKVMHGRTMAAIFNEKKSRFSERPRIQVYAPPGSSRSQAWSTELERGINLGISQIEDRSGGDAWGRVVGDVICLDGGVERWERVGSAGWPELAMAEDGREKLAHAFEGTEDEYKAHREDYKKQMGIPIRVVYVPFESFMPVWEGPTAVESFELEQRSLRSVLANPLFRSRGSEISALGESRDGDVRTYCTVVHHCNQNYHSYWALSPHRNSTSKWPDASRATVTSVGNPVFLYGYKHGLGELIYNIYDGRFGGWRNNTNPERESVMSGLLELTQDQDELLSQAKTNVRASYWPTPVYKVSKKNRGGDEGPPRALVSEEGEPITIWDDESVDILIKPMDNPLWRELNNRIDQRIGQLAGSSSLFGEHQPGVNTGYHEQLAISRGESLDSVIERHLADGVRGRARKFAKHIVAMDEKVYVFSPSGDKRKRGGKYVVIEPSDFNPMPIFDASVKMPRPVEFLSAVRAAIDASANRNGPGTPLLDDITIRTEILGRDDPDETERAIAIQGRKQKILDSGIIDKAIIQKLGIALMVQGQGQATPGQVGQAPGALQQAVQQMNMSGEAAAQGGVSPAAPQMQPGALMTPPPGDAWVAGGPGAAYPVASPTPRMGTGGGLPPGAAQPSQVLGNTQRLLAGAGR